MKKIWKVLGVAALVAGLSPYRITTDDETEDIKLRALLWKGTYGRRAGNQGLSLEVGFFPPNEEEEPHLFADELVVHYHNGQPCYADDEEAGQADAGQADAGQDSAPESVPEVQPEQPAEESAPAENADQPEQP